MISKPGHFVIRLFYFFQAFYSNYYLETKFTLGIVAKILFVRYEQKDYNVKPDPQGNAQ